eukprot:TRINITY_DN24838_c0_g1_i3.p1 TRINITY_DN24838_c0_g1~~TRINITY_DN24838_c0_g1_i3.p1  ORF type:complete len:113 (-),score=17.12 TRINITY_DN24838_c0_g1_i3:26-364(-)
MKMQTGFSKTSAATFANLASTLFWSGSPGRGLSPYHGRRHVLSSRSTALQSFSNWAVSELLSSALWSLEELKGFLNSSQSKPVAPVFSIRSECTFFFFRQLSAIMLCLFRWR